jgi:hypothetical protein
MDALSRLRQELRAWRLPRPRPAFTPRGILVPRWLAAAAVLLAALGTTLGTTAHLQMRGALAGQEARALALEERQREAAVALEAALTRALAEPADPRTLFARVDARLDERLRASEARQAQTLERRLADWNERAEAQRRLDLARVAAGLSYLDGRHGQQMARTNELMGYVLEAAAQKR